jgi:hypothetical protein
MRPAADPKPARVDWGVVAVGGVLMLVAALDNPIGADPDTGIVDLGPVGTRWLLGGGGLGLVLTGLYRRWRGGAT